MTMMGIKARDHGLEIKGATAEVTKIMAADPRRISGIKVLLHFPQNYDDKSRKLLERTAKTCPVLYSLHPDIKLEVEFTYK